MNSLITYILELNISLSVLYLIYLVFFNRDSNFNIRRFFLLMSMFIACLLPLLHIQSPVSNSGIGYQIFQLDEILVTNTAAQAASKAQSLSFSQVFAMIYLSISLLFMIRLIVLVGGIIFRTIISKKIYIDNRSIYANEKLHASSFFHIIFIDPAVGESDSLKHILEHEMHHARLVHSFDRIFSEIILSLSWLNPIAWMFRKSMIVNHEYQADNRVIEEGTDQISYQLSILNQYIGCATISNQFSTQIKKRIKMLNKSYKKGSFWKTLMLLPVSAMLFMFVACDNDTSALDTAADDIENAEVKKSAEEEIFFVVEEMPKWKDSDEELSIMIRKFIATNVKYPDAAVENGVQGKVFIKFLVTASGEVIVPDPSMLPPSKKDGELGEVVVASYRPVNMGDVTPSEEHVQLLKDEAIRVIGELPVMEPGKQRGKAVSVMYTMPINFALQ